MFLTKTIEKSKITCPFCLFKTQVVFICFIAYGLAGELPEYRTWIFKISNRQT